MAFETLREVSRRVVTREMCDALGHMNIQYYFAILGEGVFNIMTLLGEPLANISELKSAFVLHKEESEFLQEIHEGDEIYLATAIEHIGSKSLILQHRILKAENDQELFRSRFVTVNMDLNTRTSTPFSEEFKTLAVKELPAYQPET